MSRPSRAVRRIAFAAGLAAAAVVPAVAQAGPSLPVPAPPAPSIAAILANYAASFDTNNNDFNIAAHLLQQFPDLAAAAAKPGSNTILLPTDYAFRAFITSVTGRTVVPEPQLFKAVMALGKATVGQIVRYHVLPGTRFTYRLALQTHGLAVGTLQGGTFRISVSNPGRPTATLVDKDPDLRDPKITNADIKASNGILHTIDRVLLPMNL